MSRYARFKVEPDGPRFAVRDAESGDLVRDDNDEILSTIEYRDSADVARDLNQRNE